MLALLCSGNWKLFLVKQSGCLITFWAEPIVTENGGKRPFSANGTTNIVHMMKPRGRKLRNANDGIANEVDTVDGKQHAIYWVGTRYLVPGTGIQVQMDNRLRHISLLLFQTSKIKKSTAKITGL